MQTLTPQDTSTMLMKPDLQRLLVLTGDPSADEHAAKIIEALKKKIPQLQIKAVGGNHIQSTGVELIGNQTQMGAFGPAIIKKIPYHLKLEKEILSVVKQWQPQAILMLDYGSFHLRLSGKIKATFPETKLFYYIPPQLWASRPWRINTIKKNIDAVFGILPFEAKLYEQNNIDYTFVGHPLVEELEQLSLPSKADFLNQYQQPSDTDIVGLFPGSRVSEVTALLTNFLKAAELLVKEHPEQKYFFPIVQASSIQKELIESITKAVSPKINYQIIQANSSQVLSVCQSAWVASGTISLQAALVNTPVVVAYKVNRLLFALFKPLILVKHIALPNLLCGERLIPELLNQHVTPENLVEAMVVYLKQSPRESYVKGKLSQLKERLKGESSTTTGVVKGLLSFFNNCR